MADQELGSTLHAEGTLNQWHPEVLSGLQDLSGEMDRLQQEADEARRAMKALQDENSRMLLIIDEMRKRIESLGGTSPEMGDALGQAGLKFAGGKQLSGVFERLYTDAVQRIQRYCLIRSQMVSASKAATEMVSALSHKQEVSFDGEDKVPDLDRLSATATSALHGMWYSTDFLFRRACTYAMAQGVEAVGKQHASSVTNIMEDAGQWIQRPIGQEGDPFTRVRKRGVRHTERCPPCRNGSRQSPKLVEGSPFEPEPRSPRKLRQEKVMDPEPTAFTAYVAGIREARGDLGPDEWPQLEPYPSGASAGRAGLVGNLRAEQASKIKDKQLEKRISASQSLPALPKGRALL